MGLSRDPKSRRTRWAVALGLVAGTCISAWLWWKQAVHIELNPALAAGTESDKKSGVSHPDFRGEWKYDRDASDSVDPLLEAKGISYLKRIALAKLPILHVIGGDHKRLAVTVKMPPFVEQTEELPTDGTPTKSASPEEKGKMLDAVTRWSDDGQSLVTTTVDETDGKLARLVITRSLDPDRRTMYVDFQLHLPGREPLKARRVFRLIKPPAA
jgi:hypothetical protein